MQQVATSELSNIRIRILMTLTQRVVNLRSVDGGKVSKPITATDGKPLQIRFE